MGDRPMSSRTATFKMPHTYKVAYNIAREVKDNGASLKDLIFNAKSVNIRSVYALVTETLKHYDLINSVIEKSGLINEIKYIWPVRVLVAELLLGKGELCGNKLNKSLQVTLAYETQLQEAFAELKPKELNKRHIVKKPRYVRINTLATSYEAVVKRLEEEGWKLLEKPRKYEDFISILRSLNSNQFIRDYHLKNLLVFPVGTEFHCHAMYLSGEIVLQDKASCLAAHLLDPPPGSTVLDMCSGPGMKTTYLASSMNNEGTLYAVEHSRVRYMTMKKVVENYCGQASCVQTILGDALQITAEDCPGVQYILVDPSCTGSGIVRRIESFGKSSAADVSRLQSLVVFQEKMLTHALSSFPDVRRVVYSTCSVNHEENERVVERVLAKVSDFHVVYAGLKKKWKHRGNAQYLFGSLCMASDFEHDLTDGFFIAVLERITSSQETLNTIEGNETSSEDRRKLISNEDESDFTSHEGLPKKKRKQLTGHSTVNDSFDTSTHLKRKKRKKNKNRK